MPLNGGQNAGKGSWNLQLFGFHSHPWEESHDRVLHGVPEDDREAQGGQAEGDSAEATTGLACADQGHDGVAAIGGSRIFPISRRTPPRGATESIPARSAAHVVVAASPAEPKNRLDLAQISGASREPATGSRDSAPVP